MSILGVSAARAAESIGSDSTRITRAESRKISNESNATGRSVLTHTQPVNHLAVAAEELTFQFSEVIEAKETALEERLARQSKDKIRTEVIKIKEVQTIMKLMEGREGYDILRGQARSFAARFQENPEAALKQIEVISMSAEKRYALLNMALDTLSMSKDHILAKDALAKYIQQQNSPFHRADQLQMASFGRSTGATTSEREDTLFQAISIKPSIKGIWDLINEKFNGNLMDAMQETHLGWNGSKYSSLESIAGIVIVHKIMTIIHSMLKEAEKIMTRIGIENISTGDRIQRQTKMLIDLAQTSMPSTQIDKVLDSLKSSKRQCPICIVKHRMECRNCLGNTDKCNCVNEIVCRCADLRGYILSMLHLHARQWPQEVWANSDAKNLVFDQLLKKQNAPSGLLAKRMMR